jgi:nitrite reductase (NADH) small subunit
VRLACSVADVPLGEGRQAEIDGVRVAIFHTAEGWYAVQASCPHRGGPLADGLLGERSVICPLHAMRFDLADGSPLGHDCAGLRAFPLEVRGDRVYVSTTTRSEHHGIQDTARDRRGGHRRRHGASADVA